MLRNERCARRIAVLYSLRSGDRPASEAPQHSMKAIIADESELSLSADPCLCLRLSAQTRHPLVSQNELRCASCRAASSGHCPAASCLPYLPRDRLHDQLRCPVRGARGAWRQIVVARSCPAPGTAAGSSPRTLNANRSRHFIVGYFLGGAGLWCDGRCGSLRPPRDSRPPTVAFRPTSAVAAPLLHRFFASGIAIGIAIHFTVCGVVDSRRCSHVHSWRFLERRPSIVDEASKRTPV